MNITNKEVTPRPPTIAKPAINREQCVFGTMSPKPTVATVMNIIHKLSANASCWDSTIGLSQTFAQYAEYTMSEININTSLVRVWWLNHIFDAKRISNLILARPARISMHGVLCIKSICSLINLTMTKPLAPIQRTLSIW